MDPPSIYKAKREMKVLELLPFCLRMVKRRENQKLRGHERQIDLGTVMAARAKLPFELTQGQSAALDQIVAGLNGKKQFHALLQGDVGCGKTVVAMLAMMAVCGGNGAGNGMREQCALMVPTDILARQHYKNLKPFLEAAGLHVQLLVGATSPAERKIILGEMQMGLVNVVIGTHALFSKDVCFANLGFVIIDEQHRFGVAQREALLAKGNYPDMLVMSATPIPRSLAMTLYGDLKVISIKDKPAGRKPIKTRLVNASKREDSSSLAHAVRNERENGHLTSTLDSLVQHTLVLGRGAGDAARDNLATFRDKATKSLFILIVNELDVVFREPASLLAADTRSLLLIFKSHYSASPSSASTGMISSVD